MSLAALLTVVGNHVPVIPFDDVVGKAGAAVPSQIAGIGLNVGTTFIDASLIKKSVQIAVAS